VRSRRGGQPAGPAGYPIVQVAAELAQGLLAQQLPIGGADQPEVGLPPIVAPHSLVGPLLHDSQQIGLQCQGQLPDLVEEQRTAVGQGERPVASGERPGEGAPLVPEKLAAGELRRDGRAVRHDKVALLRPVLQGMDQSRGQLLAGPSFPRDQGRGIGEAGHLDDLAEGADPGRAPSDAVLAHQGGPDELVHDLPAPESGRHLARRASGMIPGEDVGGARLEQPPGEPAGQRRARRRDGQNALQAAIADLPQELTHARCHLVEDQQARPGGLVRVERARFHTRPSQRVGDVLPERWTDGSEEDQPSAGRGHERDSPQGVDRRHALHHANHAEAARAWRPSVSTSAGRSGNRDDVARGCSHHAPGASPRRGDGSGP